jgi:hypothetical protein
MTAYVQFPAQCLLGFNKSRRNGFPESSTPKYAQPMQDYGGAKGALPRAVLLRSLPEGWHRKTPQLASYKDLCVRRLAS